MHSLLKTLAALLVLGSLLGNWATTQAADPSNEQAIREVQSGQRQVAQASWWGFDAADSTQALQTAINSGAAKVVVEKMPGPWIVNKIELASNQELFFEPGAVVLAKKGAFRGTGDALFNASGKSHIKLTGYQATLQMHRADYDSPEYKKGEWRHVLNFHGCSDVVVTGLTLTESGGDGIYLGAGRHGETNRNVVIRDVVCDRNYRQGISVITAENLLIENCVLKNTAGTAPAAGIDFEPNAPSERLVNCVMRKCRIEDNQGYALHIYARPLDGTSAPVSIRIEDCTTRGANARSASIITSCGPKGAVKGSIELVNCRFEDAGMTGINIGSKPPDGVKLRLVNCTLADPAEKPTQAAPILFSTRAGDLENIGGVAFVDCTLCERIDRPLMKFADGAGVRLLDVTGTLTVERQGQRTVHHLDQKLIDRWFPFDPVLAIRPVALELAHLKPIAGSVAAVDRKLPGHRMRDRSKYLVYAAKDEKVAFRLAYQQVGRYESKPLEVQVISPAGKEIQRLSVPLHEEGECQFTAGQTGVFQVISQPGMNTVRMVSSSHPVCMAGDSGVIPLLGTVGDFYFWTPPGQREFGIRIQGEGEGERVSAAVLNAAGQKLWEKEDIGTPQSFHVQRQPGAPGEVWRLHLSRPKVGVLEDCHIELRGLPALLGFKAEEVLRTD
jgi:hypothetical protein